MSSNWNVYKVFKNGKRAKAPMYEFEFSGDINQAYDYFKSHQLTGCSDKAVCKLSSFKILNSKDNQERITKDDEEQKFSNEKNRVLAKLIREKNLDSNKRCSAGLILSKESSWKWQWALLQAATNNYISGLSPLFDSYDEANNWMNKKIVALSNGT